MYFNSRLSLALSNHITSQKKCKEQAKLVQQNSKRQLFTSTNTPILVHTIHRFLALWLRPNISMTSNCSEKHGITVLENKSNQFNRKCNYKMPICQIHFLKKLSNLFVLRYFQKQYTETCISLIQYALLTISCKSTVQYHNQNHSIVLKSNTAIDTVKVELMSIAISHCISWCCPIVLTTSSLFLYSPSIPETAYLNLLSLLKKI